jgi:2-polyprenyl-6-methoxyphenol hydroxylase-like FAD-dependent oxidoreductase
VSYDVIIAGGGVAGATTAAGLAGYGYRVLVVEPGMDHGKRLAGELLHPPSAANLNELGLLDCLKRVGVVSLQGFALFAGDKPEADSVLRYSEVAGLQSEGFAIEHGSLSECLLSAAVARSNVTLWKGARVSAIDLSDCDHASVTVSHDGQECRLRAELIVAADGRNSHLRDLAGIRHTQIHLSNMIGYVLDRTCLPYPGFGHVFAGGPAPTLAYGIGNGQTRIMFDVPAKSNGCSNGSLKPYVDNLPMPFRRDVAQAIETNTPLRTTNCRVIPETVIKGRLVCVGDAGGCCHPVSASGLSACTRDALRLKQALKDTGGDIPKGLRRYATTREAAERTRIAGAGLLYQVLKADTPETRLLRKGLLRYWKESPSGRAATMGLLSTQETRLSVMLREYIHVCGYSLPELTRCDARTRTLARLSRSLFRFVSQNIRWF